MRPRSHSPALDHRAPGRGASDREGLFSREPFDKESG